MRIGTVCYATDQGLGILAKAFSDHGIVTDAAVVAHGTHTTHWDWYPRGLRITSLHGQKRDLFAFCKIMDVMLFFETPFLWELIPYCRAAGVRTVLMPMHECTHQLLYSYTPYLLLCPSMLEYELWRGRFMCTFLPFPVEVPWKLRTRAEVFVHNAGHGGLRGRNGTKELLQAMKLVKSSAKFIVRSQEPIDRKSMPYDGDRVQIEEGTLPYEMLWTEGDVFVFPEKFNGLSLPLQEAKAAGMAVIATDRFPINTWVGPRQHLIPVKSSHKARIGPPYQEFDEAVVDPQDIADRIDSLYGADITGVSEAGREWAQSMSWEVLKPKYLEVLSR